MNFEQIPSMPSNAEKPLCTMLPEEFAFLRSADLGSERLADLMKGKGISFDMGDIVIDVDGKKIKINTSKDDFGTEVGVPRN